ncbi:hypothetical protein EG829_28200 [bacterium]|nr:hypothetical protein [bacterium]
MDERSAKARLPKQDFDYSTPEGQKALEGVLDVILDVRREANRRAALYERTLGLIVLPVLIRRAAIISWRRFKYGRPSAQ